MQFIPRISFAPSSSQKPISRTIVKSGMGVSKFKVQLGLQCDSESMLKLISILIRNGLRKTTLFISGGKSDDKTNEGA